jgi:predicted dehydrogenase
VILQERGDTIAVKIGFIGFGWIARTHLERLQEIPEAKAVAGAELDPDRRREVALKYGLRAYEDYRQMLDQEELDGVYVCIPPYAHDGQEKEIVERNLALFVEKPVCLDLTYARQTAELISARGVINAAGYMCRYLDVVEEAKRIIGTSPIVAIRGFYFAPLSRNYWWRRAELSGGQIVEQATHVIDLMRYFAGEVAQVSGEGFLGVMTDIDGYNIHDATTVNFRFANGTIGNLMTSCVLTNEYSPGLEIITRGRRICWLDWPPRARLIQLDGVDSEFVSKQDLFIREDQAFIKAIVTQNQSQIRSDYLDATKTLELTLAAQEAVERNTTIELDGYGTR